jgi:hypothetical protein
VRQYVVVQVEPGVYPVFWSYDAELLFFGLEDPALVLEPCERECFRWALWIEGVDCRGGETTVTAATAGDYCATRKAMFADLPERFREDPLSVYRDARGEISILS